MKCPSCGSESRYHTSDCRLAARLNDRLKADAYAQKLVENPEEYIQFLSLSMAAHLVKLDSMARQGDVKAAEAFRRAAMDALEVIGAQKTQQQTGGAASGLSRHGREPSPGAGAAAAIAEALGEASLELADRDVSGDGEGGDPDEG